jgi:hypothetical protein
MSCWNPVWWSDTRLRRLDRDVRTLGANEMHNLTIRLEESLLLAISLFALVTWISMIALLTHELPLSGRRGEGSPTLSA